MKIKQAMDIGYQKLNEKDIIDSFLKVKMVLAHILNVEREYLISHDDQELTKEEEEEFNTYIEKLSNGYPIQYITNRQYFRQNLFFVDENVLIPQPDTEILVDEVISVIEQNEMQTKDEELLEFDIFGVKDIDLEDSEQKSDDEENSDEIDEEDENKLDILDLCTGSGAIVISLAKEKPDNNYYASDISIEALKIATKNTMDNGVEIEIMQGDLFSAIDEYNKENKKDLKFDIIVSNPPYIESGTIPKLSKEVQYEPNVALDGGLDGLDFYRRIVYEGKKYLKNGGTLALEIGYNQKDIVTAILKTAWYTDIKCIQDLAGMDRVIVAKYYVEEE